MRFFIALEIPNENIKQFQAIQAKLHTFIPQIKLTNLDKIHLTLVFIGEQQDQLQDQLTQIIKDATKGIAPFEVTPAYLDGFPNIHHPNVIWVGVKGDIDKILLIRERIKDGMEKLRLPVDERRFIPHISIGKLNNQIEISRELEIELEKIMFTPFDPIQVTSIKLFESVPSGSFHSHNTLAEVRLEI